MINKFISTPMMMGEYLNGPNININSIWWYWWRIFEWAKKYR